MPQSNLSQLVFNGTAPRNLRMLIARGAAPVISSEALALLVFLLKDSDSEVCSTAAQTLVSWDKEEVAAYLKTTECLPEVLEYFAGADASEPMLQAIIGNPATPEKTIEALALSVPAHLLEKILDNRVRILEFPAILENIKGNSNATPQITRVVLEIETEFFGTKKKDYAVADSAEIVPSPPPEDILEPESAPPLEDLSLEGLPVDPEAREAELNKRLSSLSVPEKIKRALFGNREIRMVLVRDTNREIARSVLRSPKITENEIEGIAAMRGVAEDILREIGNSKEWTRSYIVVQNLVRNPKTPPAISQRLMFRLRAADLMQLSRDRSIPDAVRYNASRALNQRTRPSK